MICGCMDFLIWLTFGVVIMFGGGMAMKNGRFAASRADYVPLSKEDRAKMKRKGIRFFHYEGRSAIILGLVLFLIGLVIVANAIHSY